MDREAYEEEHGTREDDPICGICANVTDVRRCPVCNELVGDCCWDDGMCRPCAIASEEIDSGE